MKKLRHILIILTAILIFSQVLTGQTGTSSLQDFRPDSIVNSQADEKHSVYAMTGYGSLPIYPGSDMTGTQKYTMLSAIYNYRSKLFAAVSSLDLTGNGIYGDFTSASLIYSDNITTWFDLSLSATGFRINPGYADSLMKNFMIADITTGFNPGFLKADLSFSWLYNGQNNYFLQFKTSKYFQTPSFFGKKAFLSFDPYIKLLAGTHYRSATQILTSETVVFDTVMVAVPQNQNTSDENGNRIYSNASDLSYNYTPYINQTRVNTTSSVVTAKKSFGLMEINTGVPVSLNFRRFSLEAEAGYVFPLYNDNLLPRPKGFVFMFSALIRLF